MNVVYQSLISGTKTEKNVNPELIEHFSCPNTTTTNMGAYTVHTYYIITLGGRWGVKNRLMSMIVPLRGWGVGVSTKIIISLQEYFYKTYFESC